MESKFKKKKGSEEPRGRTGIKTQMYRMEYNSAIKRNKIVPFVEMWMDLETVIQSEVNQREKNKYSTLTHICRT